MAGKLLAMKGRDVAEGKRYNFIYSLGICFAQGEIKDETSFGRIDFWTKSWTQEIPNTYQQG